MTPSRCNTYDAISKKFLSACQGNINEKDYSGKEFINKSVKKLRLKNPKRKKKRSGIITA